MSIDQVTKEILGDYRINNCIDWATDGEEVLRKIVEGRYQLVILDMHLPKMNGIEILNEIRSSNTCALTKFTMMAGDKTQIKILKEMVPHADAFIEKPFSKACRR